MQAGYRLLPHTADVALEAWGPTRVECVAAAVRGLVSSFAVPDTKAPRETVVASLEPHCDEDLLVGVLDEVIYQLEVHDRVPVDIELDEESDGTVTVHFATVSASDVQPVGAVPKAVSLHGLRFERHGGSWRCHLTVDV